MVRIIHTADIHLDSPLRSLALRDPTLSEAVEAATRVAFEKIIDTAVEEQATAVMICGDLFDGKQRSARTAVFLTSQLDRLRAANIRVFYIKGNHDAENQLTGALDLPDNVHVFSGRGDKVQLTDDIWIHGVSFTRRQAPDSLLPRFATPVTGAINIAMLHTSLGGAPGHDVYAPCSVNELVAAGFDYWALGHIHKRQIYAEDPWVVMPGIPQGRDIGESGAKSATLLTIDDGKIDLTEVQTSAVEFISHSLDISDIRTDDALRTRLREELKSKADRLEAAAGVLRLTLQGRSQRHWQILRDSDYWQEQVTELARETSRLWIDKLIFALEAPQLRQGSATDELAAIIEAIQNEPGFANTAHARIKALVDDLPREVRARILPEESSLQSLANTLGKAGARHVLARMKSADSQ